VREATTLFNFVALESRARNVVAGFRACCSFPSSKRRGGRDIKKDAAKPPLMERTGWSGMTKHFGMPDHPVCGDEVGYAALFS